MQKGADRAIDAAAEREAGVLVDDDEDAKRRAVAGAPAHEVVRPDVVQPSRRQVPDRLLGASLRTLPEAWLRRGGTRWPSSRQSRSIRLRFTQKPSVRRSAQIRR